MTDASLPDMVLFHRAFDLLAWILPKTETFPKAYRSSLGVHMASNAVELIEHLHAAWPRRGAARVELLAEADSALAKMRVHLRLAHHFHWPSDGQYEHAPRMVAEVGRLLGGWRKAAPSGPGGAPSPRA